MRWNLGLDRSGPTNKFFNFSDLKPGDNGENTISLHVDSNNAYACAIISNLHDNDLGLTGPEQAAGDHTNGPNHGELASQVKFFAWRDDGDNIWESGEEPLFTNLYGASQRRPERPNLSPLHSANRPAGIQRDVLPWPAMVFW